MHIKIYDKYIFKQVLGAVLVCILLFVIVWIAPETLLNVVRKILDGTYSVSAGLQILFYEIPKILNKALPIGLFLGTLFTFDKLSKDSEITIFRNAGLSSARIIAPVFVLSIFVTIVCFFVNNFIGPYSCNKLHELKGDILFSNIVYITKDDFSHPKQIIILPLYTQKQVFKPVVMNFSNVYYSDASELSEIIIGASGHISQNELVVDEGRKYSINSDGVFNEIVRVDNYNVISADKALVLYKISQYKLKRERDLTNIELFDYIKLLKQEGLKNDYHGNLNKYLQRYFHSAMCILFAILGCYLGFSKPREQKLVGFIIAIAITFVYYITLPPIDVLADKGILHPIIAALFHPILLVGAILFIRKMKDV